MTNPKWIMGAFTNNRSKCIMIASLNPKSNVTASLNPKSNFKIRTRFILSKVSYLKGTPCPWGFFLLNYHSIKLFTIPIYNIFFSGCVAYLYAFFSLPTPMFLIDLYVEIIQFKDHF